LKFSIDLAARILLTLYSFTPIVGVPLWISWLQLDGELPALIASHWGLSGEADGFMAPSEFSWWVAGIFGGLWLLTSYLIWTRRLPNLLRWVILTPLLFIYFVLLSLIVNSVALQINVEDVTTVRLPDHYLWLMLAGLAVTLWFALSMPRVAIRSDRLEASIWAIPVYRIELIDIAEAKVVQLRARDYGGLGFRLARAGAAIIPRPGVGVELTSRQGQRTAIRCKNADEIINAINQKEH
jgi:hypothetical protein